MRDRILGCLLGAAVGDAMGAATELRSEHQIMDYFGGKVTDFQKPPDDTYAQGREAGQVTDAFSIPYVLLQHLINAKGKVSQELAEQALLDWAAHPEWFEPFAGMTTRKAVEKLRDGQNPFRRQLFASNYFALSSNGAATKAFALGLLYPGDIDRAVEAAVTVSKTVHNDVYSISGACAVAAAVSCALGNDATVYDIVQVGLYGAEIGEAKGRESALEYPGPSVVKRMEMAVNLALKAGDADSRRQELALAIGNGAAVAETVPAAFGLFLACGGETMPAIYGGVNIGNETSAIASIAGALAGAYHGAASIPEDYLSAINQKNQMDLMAMVQELECILNLP